jgi:D-glycero-D-manno-heptose 1,7-bisphosphate phosphatase
MKRKAVFLDRDGTINEDVGYPSEYSQVRIYPAGFEAVRRLNLAGLVAIVITNQSGIGRGLITEEGLEDIHKRMHAAFVEKQARLDGIYYCPHYERSSIPRYREDCSCRKPNPGLALQAAADFDLNLKRSYMVGDKVEDILFGRNIRATPVLVLTGYGRKSRPQLEKMRISPAYIAADVLGAAEWILKREKRLAVSRK